MILIHRKEEKDYPGKEYSQGSIWNVHDLKNVEICLARVDEILWRNSVRQITLDNF